MTLTTERIGCKAAEEMAADGGRRKDVGLQYLVFACQENKCGMGEGYPGRLLMYLGGSCRTDRNTHLEEHFDVHGLVDMTSAAIFLCEPFSANSTLEGMDGHRRPGTVRAYTQSQAFLASRHPPLDILSERISSSGNSQAW